MPAGRYLFIPFLRTKSQSDRRKIGQAKNRIKETYRTNIIATNFVCEQLTRKTIAKCVKSEDTDKKHIKKAYQKAYKAYQIFNFFILFSKYNLKLLSPKLITKTTPFNQKIFMHAITKIKQTKTAKNVQTVQNGKNRSKLRLKI